MAGRTGASLNWGGLDILMGRIPRSLMEHRKAMLKDVGQAMVTGTKRRFEKQVDPEGKTWEPSARAWQEGLGHSARKATKSRKGRRFKADSGKFGKTLTDTATLRRSIGAAVTNDTVMWGSNLKYARIHQEGGKAGRNRKVTIPKRSYLGLSDEDKAEIAAIMADHITDAFTGD